MFSWGYWGWGTKTKAFVDAANAVEKSRGFAPPFFVDIRFRRTGRAPGFIQNAFQKQVGEENYLWMQSLGNRAIGTEEGGIQINDPAGAEDLLELAIKLNIERRRVIFYCACDATSFSGVECHRYTVTELLIKAARTASIGLQVIEWPGGEPGVVTFPPDPKMTRAFRSGRRLISAGDADISSVAGMPWYSAARFGSDEQDSEFYFLGPGKPDNKGWCYMNMPVDSPKLRSAEAALEWAQKQRSRQKLAAVTSEN